MEIIVFLDDQTSRNRAVFGFRQRLHPLNSFAFHCFENSLRIHRETRREHFGKNNQIYFFGKGIDFFFEMVSVGFWVFPE